MDSLIIILKSIIYEKNGFIIAFAECDDIPLEYDMSFDGTTKIVGMGLLTKNNKYKLQGKWVNNKTYGWQFEFSSYEDYIPDKYDLKGIEKYLCSGLFKGIGPKTASAIVNYFKEDTLNVIQNDIEKLIQVKGISKKKILGIIESYVEAKQYENLMVLLSPYGVSTNKIVKICEKFGSQAENILKENPFRLCKEIEGFGFITADNFAKAIGMNPRSIYRVKEGIKYCLKTSTYKESNIYISDIMLYKRLSLLLNKVALIYATEEFEKKYNKSHNPNNHNEVEEIRTLAISFAVNDEDVNMALKELVEEKEIVIEYFVKSRNKGGKTYDLINNTLIEKQSFCEDDTFEIINEMPYKYEKDGKLEEYYITKKHEYLNIKDFGKIKKHFYLKKTWYCETLSAMDLKRIYMSSSFKGATPNLSKVIESLEKKYKVKYAKEQQMAMLEPLKKNLMVLTGGPGTGKTTTIKGILGLYSHYFPNDNIYLAAPTGRAAKRMTETTGLEAKTIHRLLEYNIDGFQRNRDNPLDCDLLILDELSMVDIELFSSVLAAIPNGCKLILVGDANQLPSVGPGSVLKDLILSKDIPIIELNEIFRQKGTSLIVVNANKINNKTNDLEYGSDFQILYEDYTIPDKDIVNDILNVYKEKLTLYGVDNVQLLVPYRKKSLICVEELNKVLAPIANPITIYQGKINYGDTLFRENDRVMQMNNDYEKNVYNGDIGKIIRIYGENEDVVIDIDFDGNVISYKYEDLENLVLAYATTIHKSQGSEYKCVIMPIVQSQTHFLNRNIFYTGITRAMKEVTLIAHANAIQIAINKNDEQKRKSHLATKINEQFS